MDQITTDKRAQEDMEETVNTVEALKRAEEVKQLTSFKYEKARHQLYYDILTDIAGGNWNADVLARIALSVEKPIKGVDGGPNTTDLPSRTGT